MHIAICSASCFVPSPARIMRFRAPCVKVEWSGKLYCGASFTWVGRTTTFSMPRRSAFRNAAIEISRTTSGLVTTCGLSMPRSAALLSGGYASVVSVGVVGGSHDEGESCKPLLSRPSVGSPLLRRACRGRPRAPPAGAANDADAHIVSTFAGAALSAPPFSTTCFARYMIAKARSPASSRQARQGVAMFVHQCSAGVGVKSDGCKFFRAPEVAFYHISVRTGVCRSAIWNEPAVGSAWSKSVLGVWAHLLPTAWCYEHS